MRARGDTNRGTGNAVWSGQPLAVVSADASVRASACATLALSDPGRRAAGSGCVDVPPGPRNCADSLRCPVGPLALPPMAVVSARLPEKFLLVRWLSVGHIGNTVGGRAAYRVRRGDDMDVAIVATAKFPIDEPFAGGMEMHTHVLAEGLTARGHDVTIYAAGGRGRFTVEQMLPIDFIPSDAARLDVTDVPQMAIAEHHSYLDAVLRVCRAKHELVHINTTHYLPFACSSMLRCAVTGTLHSPPTSWLESALALAATRPNAPELVSVSRSNAKAWTAPHVTKVIANGVDLERWRVGPGGPTAVWTGRVVPEKAPHLAIDAARLAGVPLRLLGPILDRRYFEYEIRPRLGGTVEYRGHRSVDDVAHLVANSSVAIVTPVWEEPFGLVVPEALACGTPIAGFATGALPELVDPSTGRLARLHDVEGLANAIVDAAGALANRVSG